MAFFFLLILLALSASARSVGASWCVCKSSDPKALQTSIDYACGHGADCSQILQNKGCYAPNTLAAHCNYAVNSYFQKNNQLPTACEFSGTAAISTTDPSTQGCAYPSSASSSSSSSTGTSTGMGPPSSTIPNGSPLVTSPTTTGSGILGGGTNSGGTLGPTGIDTDVSAQGEVQPFLLGSSVIILAFSMLVFW